MKYAYKSTNWALLKWVDIPDGGRPNHVYLRRLVLFKTPWFGVQVHWIYVKDSDRDPHNHPSSFLSLVLRGGYIEQRQQEIASRVERRNRIRWSVARTTRKDFHTIVFLDGSPVITLLLTGPRSSDGWGFLTPDGYVPQEVYVPAKEEGWRIQAAKQSLSG
jgi:hypothetical protein